MSSKLTCGAKTDVTRMLELLRYDKSFDHLEGFFGTNKDKTKIAELTDELVDCRAQIKAQSSRIDYLVKENSKLKEGNEKQRDSIEDLNLQINRLREWVRVLREDPHAGPVLDHSWHGSYNVRAFIIISPDRKSAYKVYIEDEVDNVLKTAQTWTEWQNQTKKNRLSCSAGVWCVIDCKSISDLLKRYDVKFADMVLTPQWQVIEEPNKTEVRNFIILESKTKKEQRALQFRIEREKANERLPRIDNFPPDKNIY